MNKKNFGNSAKQTCLNTEETIANVNMSTPSNCHDVRRCCGKVCKELRGLKMHQQNCKVTKDLHRENFEVMQETMSEHSNMDTELGTQYACETPNIKIGIKLPKSDEQWSTANHFSQCFANFWNKFIKF